MLPDIEPDREEKVIRFVCGAVVGGIFGFFASARIFETVESALLFTTITALICGFLAMYEGNEFWEWLGRNSWW